MLVIKAFINHDQIDEIHIQNICPIALSTEDLNDKKLKDLYLYKIVKPEGFMDDFIYHDRKDSWKSLAKKALEILEKKRGVKRKQNYLKKNKR